LICGLCKSLFGRPPTSPARAAAPSAPGFKIPAAPPAKGSSASAWVFALIVLLAVGAGAAYRRHHRLPPPPAHVVATPAVSPPAIVEEAAALPSPRLSVSAYWYEGADGYRRALDEQRSARAPLLIYFRVDWCPYCRSMDRDVLPASSVIRFLGEVVKVRVNVEASPADRALAERFGVKGYPSVYVIPVPDAPPHPVPSFSRTKNEDITVTAEKFVKACEEVGLRQSRGLVRDGYDKVRRGDPAGARADLDQAIEIDPRNAQAFLWRGYLEAEAGEKGKAAGDLKRAIELDPREPFAYSTLARLYLLNGQFDDAIATLGPLIDTAPDWQRGLGFALRGEAYGRKGDTARAFADHGEACRRQNARSCNLVAH
jgi:thioredoxin-like negative regulator of GroEL